MRRVVGCMTGTSIDGIDVALVEIEGEGLSMSARFVRGESRGLGTLASHLKQVADQERLTAGEIARIGRDFALLHAEVIGDLLGDERADLICIHGQTVYHQPPLSWQLFNPAPVVQALRTPVVFDLRAADLAAGGEGAPITPLADWVLFRHLAGDGEPVAVVNLGGFINMTRLPAQEAAGEGGNAGLLAEVSRIKGGDLCACNQLLDRIARDLLGRPYDAEGACALRGAVHQEALAALVEVLSVQAVSGRSLGTGDEGAQWIVDWRSRRRPEDVARTACEAIGRVVGKRAPDARILLAGGGVRNRALREAIEASCSGEILTTDDAGVPAAFREPVCFAVLGAVCQDRIPISLPQITGAERAPLAGCWMYP